jgi:Short repeat of unknown function (DUF308)
MTGDDARWLRADHEDRGLVGKAARSVASEDYGTPPPPSVQLKGTWQATLFLGAVTPASSLNVLAVLLGIWFIIMGIFEIIGGFMLRHALRAADRTLTNA